MAYIGMGSNLGDRAKTLEDAVAALAATPGVSVRAVSSFHETVPTGGPEGQGAFLNAAAVVESQLEPVALLHALQSIEQGAGRVRRERWGARTLDLDLLLVGPVVLRSPELTLPHPLMAVRRFVLAPLVEVAPEAVDPMTSRTAGDLLINLDRRPSRIDFIDPDDHRRDDVVRRLGAVLDPSTWSIGGVDVSKTLTTFRVVVGDPGLGPALSSAPTIFVDPADGHTIAAYLLALCRATGGA